MIIQGDWSVTAFFRGQFEKIWLSFLVFCYNQDCAMLVHLVHPSCHHNFAISLATSHVQTSEEQFFIGTSTAIWHSCKRSYEGILCWLGTPLVKKKTCNFFSTKTAYYCSVLISVTALCKCYPLWRNHHFSISILIHHKIPWI